MLTYAAQRFPEGQKLLVLKPRMMVSRELRQCSLPLTSLTITVFVFIDIVTIAVQVVGAAMVGVVQTRLNEGKKPPMSTQTAGHILLAGLAVQTVFFTCFICLLALAITRVKRLNLTGKILRNLRMLLYTNIAAALFILLRTVYRLAVECQGESHQ